MKGDPTFTPFWRTGQREVLREMGRDIAEAMNNSGYSAGALRALDFHAKGDCDDYVWNPGTRECQRPHDTRSIRKATGA